MLVNLAAFIVPFIANVVHCCVRKAYPDLIVKFTNVLAITGPCVAAISAFLC